MKLTLKLCGYRLHHLDEPVFTAVSKPLLTEFGIHHRLESWDCGYLQGVVVIAGLLTDRAHEVGGLGVGGHVGPEGGPSAKSLGAAGAVEVPLPSVDHQVGAQVELVAKDFVTVGAGELPIGVGIGGEGGVHRAGLFIF